MDKKEYFSIDFKDDKIVYLDQTGLPFREEYVETDDYERVAEAIERLEIRGAPLIGIAAAYALSLSIKNFKNRNITKITSINNQKILIQKLFAYTYVNHH